MHLINKLFILAIWINFSDIFCDVILRTDYYKSLSHPSECLVVSHYFPSGPLFLYVKFEFNLYSFIFGYESKNYFSDSYFKKINRYCNNSIFATTIGKDFRILYLEIKIYLLKKQDRLAEFHYAFYQGVPQGHYKIWDSFKHFSIHVRIFHYIKKYSELSVCSSRNIESYFNSISNNSGNLCLVTQNNKAIVLKPEYGSVIPNGFIYKLKADILENELFNFLDKYVAFNCVRTEDYPDEPVILIIDKPKLYINFMVKTLKYSNGEPIEEYYEFKLYNTQYMYVDYMEYVPETYKKVFLMRLTLNFVQCRDDTEAVEFLSDNNIKYYVLICKEAIISSFSEHFICNSHSLVHPC